VKSYYFLSTNSFRNFSVDLFENPKVAFLSSHSRTYFPDDTGTSRFGVANAVKCCTPEEASETPEVYYKSKYPLVEKPISLLGYGIGGLSKTPRFPKVRSEGYPAPNQYQENVVPPVYRKSKGLSRKSTKKSHAWDRPMNSVQHNDNPIAGNVQDLFLREMKSATKSHAWDHPKNVFANKPTIEKPRTRFQNEKKRRGNYQDCYQSIVGFGSNLGVSRFTDPPNSKIVG
jgi:hypothetical protein